MQQLLGTDKRNPVFSLFRDEAKKSLDVYYGAVLLERVPDDRNHVQYKLMVAQLYNAKLKATELQKVFGYDRKTMKKYGEALTSGDVNKLAETLAGRNARRKLIPEIRNYIQKRFPSIYQETKYAYSQRMREEIQAVFGYSLSGESLRPLLKELKEKMAILKNQKRESACDGGKRGVLSEKKIEIQQNQEDKEILFPVSVSAETGNRKAIPEKGEELAARFSLCHHVGVLLFSAVFIRLEDWIGEGSWILKQWLATILLGAVNIEQTKLLDFEDLKRFFGLCVRTLSEQRKQLYQLAETNAAARILQFNAKEVSVVESQDFYYDPHTKRYTGMQKVLKGWCPGIRMADKAWHSDCIHTAQGQPVDLASCDNYEDLRERFFRILQRFRERMGLTQILTFIVDRGIYSHSVFEQIMQSPDYHLITWEKNYQPGEWGDGEKGSFTFQRCRNRASDLLTYTFEYHVETWKKDENMRRIRVRATNPQEKTIEVGILTDDPSRPAPEIIELIFRRWIQENDFKYLDKHFGINEITSYGVTAYVELHTQLNDKTMKSAEHKALQMELKLEKEKLGKILVQEQQSKIKGKHQEEIEILSRNLSELKDKIKHTEKEVSRLEFLVDEDYVRLDGRNKYLMDALKFLARNSFYAALQPFKELYDNYRDDHVLFREFIRCDGVIREGNDHVEVLLLPTPLFQPKVREIFARILEDINAQNPCMPNGSNRRLHFRLGKKEEFLLAIL